MDADAAGFKLFGKVIQPPDAAHQRAAEENAPPPPPHPMTPSPTPLPPPLPAAAPGTGEPLPCPRCGSRETKFCYFNNYNVRQPRHLCRACRRYWTAGGALRRVTTASPGRRRPRPSAARSSAVSTSSAEESGGERSLPLADAGAGAPGTRACVTQCPPIPAHASSTGRKSLVVFSHRDPYS